MPNVELVSKNQVHVLFLEKDYWKLHHLLALVHDSMKPYKVDNDLPVDITDYELTLRNPVNTILQTIDELAPLYFNTDPEE